MPTTDKLPPLRRRDLRAYRVGTLRRRSRRQVGAVVASVVGVALLAAVAPPVLSGDTPAEAVAGLPARLAGLGDLAARGADQAVRGADGAIGAIVASRSGGRDAIQQAPSPSAMASAAVGEPEIAAQEAGQLASSATAPATASPTAPTTAAAAPSSVPAGAAPTPAAPAAPPAPASASAPGTPLGPQVAQEPTVASGVTAVAPTAVPTPAVAPSLTADEQYAARLVTLTNAERAKAGLAALATSPCATAQAAARAAVLVAQGRFEHDPLEPIVAACGGSSVGENLALGYRTPEAMTAGWMASPGHRENILRAYSAIGIGCVTGSTGVLCSQVFLG